MEDCWCIWVLHGLWSWQGHIHCPSEEGLKNCRPVSRILFPAEAGYYHLSGMVIAGHLYLPTHSRLPFERNRASSPGCGIYLAFQHARFTRILPYSRKL